jgi:hypothetical protein
MIDFVVILQALVDKHPILVSILLVMGTLRAVLKPLMALAHAYAASTKSAKDDELVAKVEASKPYKLLSFVLDYVASIKLPA